MKANTIPKPITDLSTAIAGYQAEIERRHADIERASRAFTEAERLNAELAALAERRAQVQAAAFIQRTKPDTAALDAEEAALDRASRATRADGRAAEIAISILREQVEELTSKIEAAVEERRQLALKWLEDRSKRAIDRYWSLLLELGQTVAEAAGADKAQGALGNVYWERQAGARLLADWREIEHGALVPATLKTWNHVDPLHPRLTWPAIWFRDPEPMNAEREALLALFRGAGVLPPEAATAD